MIMLRNTALAVFLTALAIITAPLGCVVSASTVNAKTITSCYDYSDLDINVEPEQCNERYIIEKFLLPAFEVRRQAAVSTAAVSGSPSNTGCNGGAWNDIMAMTGTTEIESAQQKINLFCEKRRSRSKRRGTRNTSAIPTFPGVTPIGVV